MHKLRPTRLLTATTVFLALTAVGGLTIQMTNPEPGFARETGGLPELAAKKREAASRSLPASGTFAPVVEAVLPAVVSITTERTVEAGAGDEPLRYFFGPGMLPGPQMPGPRQRSGAGSGVILSSDGYVVTNHHVIAGARKITIYLTDKRKFKAEVVGTDPQTDIALLRVQTENLPKIALGNAESIEVGDIVLALGNPFGVGQTVTMGIIGATGRGNLGIERYENFIQTDAAINPGNSGGALVNTRGELIGINTAIISRSGGGNQGVGFAVPINMAHHVMKQLASHGHVSRGYMGVGIQPVDRDIAAAFGAGEPGGALVTNVEPESPADKAGLQQGDIIRKLNGEAVEDPRKLSLKVAEQAPGSEAALAVLRNGRERKLTVKLGEHPEFGKPEFPAGKSASGSLGISVQTLTPELAERLRVEPETRGVVVSRVQPGSPAAGAGIQRGDVIEQVNRHETASAGDFRNAVADSGGKPILLLLDRRGSARFVVVHR